MLSYESVARFFVGILVYNIITAILHYNLQVVLCVFSYFFFSVCFVDEMYINIYDFVCFIATFLYNDLRLTCCSSNCIYRNRG